MPSWNSLSDTQKEAVNKGIHDTYEDMEDDLIEEGDAALARGNPAALEDIVDNVLSDIVCTMETLADDIGYDPFDDDEDDDEAQSVNDFIDSYYYGTLIPGKVPAHLLEQIDRYK
ncbi:MAG: hypothetical protein ACNA8W_14520 [Bradymonadaceae bacterium]